MTTFLQSAPENLMAVLVATAEIASAILAACTPAGQQRLQDLCSTSVPKAQTHAQAADAAIRFFNHSLR